MNEPELPKFVTQEMLDANPELVAAGVQVGSPIEEATDEEASNAVENGTGEIVEPTETQTETAVEEETPAPAETVEELVEETTPAVPEEKKTELEQSEEVGTLPNTTKEQFVAYVAKLMKNNPEEYLRKKAYLDKVLIAYNK